MIELSTVGKKPHHQIRQNKLFQSDLLWWDTFLEDWNGVSALGSICRGPPVATLTLDATWGWGAERLRPQEPGFSCSGPTPGLQFT